GNGNIAYKKCERFLSPFPHTVSIVYSELFKERPFSWGLFLRAVLVFHHPICQNRHKGLRSQKGSYHSKSHSHRQRHKHILWNTRHNKGRGQYGKNTDQNQQFRDRYFEQSVQNGSLFGLAHFKMLVYVLYRYGGFIDENTD